MKIKGEDDLKYSEQTLSSWTAPLSSTEEQRATKTISMIKSAIDGDADLKFMDIEIFIQGSYANNTNVRTESDIDVCVMLKDTFHGIYPEGKTYKDYNFSASDFTFREYRNMVKRALQAKFYVQDGNKSLKINENTYHVKADVVPAFQLRNYSYKGSTNPNIFIEGIWIIANDGKAIINYPRKHIQNGITKNNETNKAYKKLVRIMKHIRNNMVDDNITNKEIITSFLVECLVYHIPNSIITSPSTWTETLRQSIIYLYKEIHECKHKDWCEVSCMLPLFYQSKWTDLDAKQWLYDTWNYLNF